MSTEGALDNDYMAIVMEHFKSHANVADFVNMVDVVVNRPDLVHDMRLVKVLH